MKPLFLLLALLVALSGCSVYDSIFHPYRLPTPPLSPELKRQMKAKGLVKKNRDKTTKTKKPKSADPDAAPEATAADAAPADKPAADKDDPTAPTEPKAHKHGALYDKREMLKKPKLLRRRYHKPAGDGFHPLRGIKNYFKYKLHGKPDYKHKPAPKAAPADAAPADAAPADAAPADAEPTPDK